MYTEHTLTKPFHETLQVTRKAIVNAGFLLLHEINTKEILATSGIRIGELRQLLFFHPRYMQEVLEKDPRAVIRVPLKIVLREIGPKQTSLVATDAIALFENIPPLSSLAEALQRDITTIVQEVA